MSEVKIDINEVVKGIDKELGEARSGRIQNKAINKGMDKVADDLENAFGKFIGTKYSTGATRDEITILKARQTKNARIGSIGWRGPKDRYRLVHLNEWGYTRKGKKYRPRMQGTIGNTMQLSEPKYFNIVHQELRKEYAR
ncbi:hypothetical protein P7H75_14035 [Vagococcus carniphilus]|uniref:hypothetical protein n=1 Tax=Vagococcus carniphilus TaxID=218144 RepID=UPI00288D7781|nr:hypothetical protein [Vagococcus carniphilus]MDT2815975.1 hypothetical protein [Vagococcus carniphilus]